MERTKANFKAWRETVGISQQGLADALHVDKRSIQRWEAPQTEWMPPADAWQVREEARKNQKAEVEELERIAGKIDLHKPVLIKYWRNQNDFIAAGNTGDYQQANASARMAAYVLESNGRAVSFVYSG